MGFFDFFKKQEPDDFISLQRDLEIINDCAELIEKTANPDTFFNRYDLYMKKLSILADAQASHRVTIKGDNLTQKYKRMNNEEQRIETINAFIDRMWTDTCQKAEKLKTEKGKANRFNRFIEILTTYNDCMPAQCIEYYNYLFSNAPRTTSIKRNQIPSDKIDKMQKIEASENYKKKIYNMYYSDYPEKPFISQDRELNTNWIEQSMMFPEHSIIPKSMMRRYSDGLLPGHVYMLYWLEKYTNKRIPAYFEYKYGIDFNKEKIFLTENGYLKDDKPTEKGKLAISEHYEIIEDQHPTPKYTGGQSHMAPITPKRSFSDCLKEEEVLIPERDKKIIADEISYINKLIDQALALAHVKKRLQINEKKFLYGIGYTYYSYTPFTPTKRLSKSPLTMYYAYTSHKKTAPTQDYFGNICFLRNGTIGSARLIFWDHDDGYIINLGIIDGILSVKKVEHNVNFNWVPLYKA
ncbi:MAG: hypothetical protein Q4D45_13080 [Lachnospiraceae bacterium]|nr:hypothetical protein [Lachnospiraceae bacterium]